MTSEVTSAHKDIKCRDKFEDQLIISHEQYNNVRWIFDWLVNSNSYGLAYAFSVRIIPNWRPDTVVFHNPYNRSHLLRCRA